MHIHSFKNGRGLPSAIITLNDGLLFSPTGMISSYEVEIVNKKVYTTGYMRSRQEIEQWRLSTKADFEHIEAGLVRYYPNLQEGFLTTFLHQIATEISERLRLQAEWLAKQQEKRAKMEREKQPFEEAVGDPFDQGTA
jgi:hypothetical protein